MNKKNVIALADHLEKNVKGDYDQTDNDKCIMAYAAELGGHDGHGPRMITADKFLGIDCTSWTKGMGWNRFLYAKSPLGSYNPDHKDASAVLRYFAITGILDWTMGPGYFRHFYKDRYKAGEEQ